MATHLLLHLHDDDKQDLTLNSLLCSIAWYEMRHKYIHSYYYLLQTLQWCLMKREREFFLCMYLVRIVPLLCPACHYYWWLWLVLMLEERGIWFVLVFFPCLKWTRLYARRHTSFFNILSHSLYLTMCWRYMCVLHSHA